MSGSNVIDFEQAKSDRLVALVGEAVFGTISIVDGHVRIDVRGDYSVGAAERIAQAIYMLAGQLREEARNGR